MYPALGCVPGSLGSGTAVHNKTLYPQGALYKLDLSQKAEKQDEFLLLTGTVSVSISQ